MSRAIPFTLLKRKLPLKFIVCGHLVQDGNHLVANYYRYPSLEEFDAFIILFRKLGYKFVGLNDYLKEDDQKKVLLTFDDGFKTVFDNLHPYMLKNEIPYMLFIMTDPLYDPGFQIKTLQRDPTLENSEDRLFLSEAEIVKLRDQGVHIGFHTRSHYKIKENYLDNEECLNQLRIPARYLHLFSQPLCFAYPYYAPDDYELFNHYMKENFNYTYFFDTKGFFPNRSNHFFRISMDVEKKVMPENWLRFVIKRQLLFLIINQTKKLGRPSGQTPRSIGEGLS